MKVTSSTDPATQSASIVRASAKLRTALALFESGVALKRAQLRRQDASASEAQVSKRLAAWLRTRPGATYGDSAGEPRDVLPEE
jgi:Rv0078B-related antitoxin